MRIVIRERKWAKLREEFIDLYEHTRTCKVRFTSSKITN